MHNHMPMTTRGSIRKPHIEFQYGGRLFSETGSSFISPMDWDISPKFGMQLLIWVQSLNLNPKEDFRLYGRHFEKSIWRNNFISIRPITTKFGRQMHNDMLMTTHGSKLKPKVAFLYGGRPFS